MSLPLARKIAVTGATAAVIVGAGTAALATSGSDHTSGSGTTSTQHSKHTKDHRRAKELRAMLRRSLHGQVTTKSKDGYVTHSGIRGAVTAVSPTSITVKATDGFSETFTLTKDTHVREHKQGEKRPAKGTVSDLKTGDQVAVLGKAPEHATAAPTATVVLDGLKKK